MGFTRLVLEEAVLRGSRLCLLPLKTGSDMPCMVEYKQSINTTNTRFVYNLLVSAALQVRLRMGG